MIRIEMGQGYVFNATFNNISLISWRENRNIDLHFLLNGSTKILNVIMGAKQNPVTQLTVVYLSVMILSRVRVTRPLVFCVYFVDRRLFFCPLSAIAFSVLLRLLITPLILLKINNNIWNQVRSKSLDWTAYKQINFQKKIILEDNNIKQNRKKYTTLSGQF